MFSRVLSSNHKLRPHGLPVRIRFRIQATKPPNYCDRRFFCRGVHNWHKISGMSNFDQILFGVVGNHNALL